MITHGVGLGYQKGAIVAKSKQIIFKLYRPESERSFTKIVMDLKKFEKVRSQFEDIGLYVEVVDVKG